MRSSAAGFVAVVLLCLPLAACSTLIQSARGLTVGDVIRGGQPKRLFVTTTRGDSLRLAVPRVPRDSSLIPSFSPGSSPRCPATERCD